MSSCDEPTSGSEDTQSVQNIWIASADGSLHHARFFIDRESALAALPDVKKHYQKQNVNTRHAIVGPIELEDASQFRITYEAKKRPTYDCKTSSPKKLKT